MLMFQSLISAQNPKSFEHNIQVSMSQHALHHVGSIEAVYAVCPEGSCNRLIGLLLRRSRVR